MRRDHYRQKPSPEMLQYLQANPVVVWVELPGSICCCGHFGYLVVGVHSEPIRITNKGRPLSVCEHMGHIIE
jgi:hypothetical protein